MPGVADKLKFSQKMDRNLGSRTDAWCEFHKAFGHNVERCIALGHQQASLVKEGFLKEYPEVDQEEPKGEIVVRDQAHETSVHGKLNTISGGSSASKHKRYARVVMFLDTFNMATANAFMEFDHDAGTLFSTYTSKDCMGIAVTKRLAIYQGIPPHIPLNRLSLHRRSRKQPIS